MDAKHAHERIDALDTQMRQHMLDHEKFEKAMTENAEMTRKNAEMTRQLVENTREIVDLVKGAKGFRAFILWLTPIVAAGYGIYTWIKS